MTSIDNSSAAKFLALFCIPALLLASGSFDVASSVIAWLKTMPSNFSPDFYESILEASDSGELWGIENSDLTPLEIQLILSHDFSWYI